jgi:hypothetical protein
MQLTSQLDRYDRDDMDILYILAPHGWSTCILYVEGITHLLCISHVFGDPIYDLISATISTLKGTSDVEFIWWDEPGGNRWKIVKNKEKHHQVIITVTEFSSSYGDPITEEKILAEFEVKTNHFATLIYYQMKKIESLLKEKSFEKNRAGEFPYTEFLRLESFFLD